MFVRCAFIAGKNVEKFQREFVLLIQIESKFIHNMREKSVSIKQMYFFRNSIMLVFA